ncbi:MAG: hypothetical protein IPL49_14695 [Saprospirales bacterium]|nr:hypothetical protein [Saprospirales bacterium]MBK8492090.1 hypothetical protein [Saprospirales bacterium]
MKLLLIYSAHFPYHPNVQSLEMADPAHAASFAEVQTAFIQAEEEDVERESKADPAFTKRLFDHLQERLINTGYEVSQTPFGYFLDLNMQAPGLSLARVFKNI